ncbi:rab-GTPase-TBC domain-containing protein [Cyathus striatus]|nr:rab-GTPase-TBC domain-containing protein [Cyathus striatus]
MEDEYASSDLAYCNGESPPSGSTSFDTIRQSTGNELSVPNGVPRVSHTAKRPASSFTTPSLRPISQLKQEKRPASNNYHSHNRSTDASATSHTSFASRSIESRHSTSQTSRQSSSGSYSGTNTRHSDLSIRELPPLPASSRTSPAPTPPRQPSPQSTPKKSIKSVGKQPEKITPITSDISLVPSEGEDVDAFHVRSTYAQLESSGVRGDGYEDGVERTRARVGASRASQLEASAAVADQNEKTRELSPKEIQLLSNVDRYGFFSIPSHDRLVLLSSSPLLKRLALTPAGPASAPTNAKSLSSLPPVPLPIKESSRIGKWTRMLQPLSRDSGGNIEVWRIKPSKEGKLRERTYKGIPDRWRAAAWDLLMNKVAKTGAREMAMFGREYREALDKPSTYDIQIDLDVPRTISGHIMFKTRYGAGQRSLFHVLHSFSLRCSSCGYVQGMGPIAATMLCYFEPERVYASLVRLHDAYSLHTVFSPGFPGMLEAIYVQERITQQMMPSVYEAFKKHMVSTTSYATKWYITLFANSVPFQTQLRLWDAFLLEGYDVFVAVSVAIVWVYRDHITSNAANFETVLSLLSSFFVPEDENVFLQWIEKTLGDKKLRENMIQWRNDWKGLVASGKEGDALL